MCKGPEDTPANIKACIREYYDQVHTANMLTDWQAYAGISKDADKMIRCLTEVIEEMEHAK